MEFNVALYKQDFAEICKSIYSKAYNFVMHVIALVYLAMGSACLIIKENMAIGIAFLILAVLTEVGSVIRKKKFVKITIERVLESTANIEPVEYSYIFNENSVAVTNITTKANTELSYISITKYIESKKFLILLTKAKQFFVIYKEDANKENLKEFLNNKVKSNRPR